MKKREINPLLSVILALVLPFVLLAMWQISANAVNSAVLIPQPKAVWERLVHPFTDLMGIGTLTHHAGISLIRVCVGFFVGAVIGVLLGIFAGMNRFIGAVVEPFVELLRSICPVAWIPFALVLFKLHTLGGVFGGSMEQSIFREVLLAMIFVIAYGALFPVFINTLHGVRSVRTIYLEAASMLGSRGFHRFFKVILPGALPSIVTGLRIGLGTSWFVIVAAEMLPGPSTGLGYLIIYAYQMSEMDILMAGMIMIGLTGGVLHFTMKQFTGSLIRWQTKER